MTYKGWYAIKPKQPTTTWIDESNVKLQSIRKLFVRPHIKPTQASGLMSRGFANGPGA